MKNQKLKGFILLCLFSFASCKTSEQDLVVKAFDRSLSNEKEQGLMLVDVFLKKNDSLFKTTTDFDGKAVFKDLPKGIYSLSISATGYHNLEAKKIFINDSTKGKEIIIEMEGVELDSVAPIDWSSGWTTGNFHEFTQK